jgi:hypothetical protein
MGSFTIKPTVDQAREFVEIASDFCNPLELVREAISNSFDARAKRLVILFDVVKEYGESILRISLDDDGRGMDRKGLQAFFDLGNSPHRDDPETMGEKGHGTKVYFNSAEITVETVCNGTKLTAIMRDPYRKLFDRQIPEVSGNEELAGGEPDGTKITIKGYNNNRRDRFTHEILKDYVYWFTKFGSVEHVFREEKNRAVVLELKGLNRNAPETLSFGHLFPEPSASIGALFSKYVVDAPHHFCRRIVRSGQLKNFPEIRYQAVFSMEGTKVKQSYNPMLRRRGYTPADGAYQVQERYGLWLCRDYIPVQRANDWISPRGSEYTRFHAFFNCQDFRLTANRGSVNNTPVEVMNDVQREVGRIFDEITDSSDWKDIEYLESEAEAYRTTEREQNDFAWRKKKFNQSNVATFREHSLVEPSHESGVYGLLIQLSSIEPNMFPFEILDYNTHTGIDVIVKADRSVAIHQSKLYYVELKYYLTNTLNHSFRNLRSIVCWDTSVKHGDVVTDINEEARTMTISAPSGTEGDYTRYFLDHPKTAEKIEVYVLKDYLREKYGIEFRPRTDKATL